MKSPRLSSLIRLGISLGAVALVLYFLRGKLDESWHILRTQVNFGWFTLAAAVYSGCLALLAIRLYFVFQVQNLRITLRDTFYLGFIGLFFNLFFPSAVGGDVAKAYYAYQHSGDKIASTTAVLLDRLMGFVAMILMAIVALGFFSRELNDPRINNFVYLFLGIMLFSMTFFGSRRFARKFQFLFALIPSEKWRGRLKDVYHAIYGYKKHRGILALTLFLSFLAQSLVVMIHYWLAVSLGADISPWICFVLVPIVTIVSMAPSVSGLGVREAGMTYLFSRFMASERALALSLLLDILIYGYSLAAGLWFAMRGGLKSKLIHDMEELQ